MKRLALIIFLALLSLSAIFLVYRNSEEKPYIKIDDKKIFVEIADSAEERGKGLMFRESLCQNCGMLFVFENEDFHSFWMKNTKISLDIVFINSNLEIVDIISASPCLNDPCQTYIPKQKALYVLEVNEGLLSEDVIGKKAEISFDSN